MRWETGWCMIDCGRCVSESTIEEMKNGIWCRNKDATQTDDKCSGFVEKYAPIMDRNNADGDIEHSLIGRRIEYDGYL